MLNQGAVKSFFSFVYFLAKSVGLMPAHFDAKRQRFEAAWYDLLWSMFIWLTFSYFFITSGLTQLRLVSQLAVISFYHMTIGTISVIFLMQCLNARGIARFLNGTKVLIGELRKIADIRKVNQTRPLLLMLLKTVVVNLLAQIAVVNCTNILNTILSGRVGYSVIVFVSLAYVLQALVPNMFYLSALCATAHFENINAEIERIIHQAHLLVKSEAELSSLQKSVRYCELSDRLDCVAVLHYRLTSLLVDANRIFSVQLLVSTTNFVGFLIIEVIWPAESKSSEFNRLCPLRCF